MLTLVACLVFLVCEVILCRIWLVEQRKETDDAASMFAFAFVSIPSTDLEIGFRSQKKSARNTFRDRFHVCIGIAEWAVNLSDLQEKKFEVTSQIFS
ncbi:hypothetical protein FH972_005645 [Carpinus fangiana]|uniref:Uncharacterized protein n=1 Tax=Carpinus fangiana TaxID=176857 RepID=A0A5N6QQV7_9ROSI|nr:hypothetical protein FH972_005645 [Carpinus fangiana]